ncbi:MAG: beta-galactosidase [Clostridia bacterium]|nr:beta-galactosidase [Clostridia bacterium]
MMRKVTKIASLLHGGDYNPDQWLRYPEILEKDAELMKKAGCNAMSIGIFAWAALEPEEGKYEFKWLDEVIDRLYQNGVYTVLATPSGARPAWMAEKYPEVLRVGADGRRIHFSARHNHCYTSPVYREKVRAINLALAERYSRHPAVILWHISNEYSGACFCDKCVAAFREWLKAKYGTLDELNHAWWTSFWSKTYFSWDQIEPPFDNGERGLHGLVLDWKRFVTDRTVDFMKAEIEPLKKVNPALPVTTNMMGFYEGLNYFKFKDISDVISWDNYPGWHSGDDRETAIDTAMSHDLMRGIKPGTPFLMMESCPSATNWRDYAKLKRPGMHELASLQAVARGSDSVQYFQWRKGRGGPEKFHGAVVGHLGTGDTRVFREVEALGKRMKGLDRLVGSPFVARAAMICDTENRWALKEMRGLIQEDKGFLKEARRHYAPLFRLGVNVDLVDEESDLSRYELVVAPMLYMLRAGIAEKLRSFVERGGTLVATYWSGIVNETDLTYLGGFPGNGLQSLFGVAAEEIDTLYPGDRNAARILASPETEGFAERYEIRDYTEAAHPLTATVLAEYEDDFVKGLPALTVNRCGKGRVFYLAAVFEDALYRDLYRKLASELSLRVLDVELPEGVFLSSRILEDNTVCYIFQNFYTTDISFPLPRAFTDLETGEEVREAVLPGYGTAFLL